ncbi:hypothetical protein [Gymnodinialimonas sp.]
MSVQRYHYPPHLRRMPEHNQFVKTVDKIILEGTPPLPPEMIRLRIENQMDADVPTSAIPAITKLVDACRSLISEVRGLIREIRWFFIFLAVALALILAK